MYNESVVITTHKNTFGCFTKRWLDKPVHAHNKNKYTNPAEPSVITIFPDIKVLNISYIFKY